MMDYPVHQSTEYSLGLEFYMSNALPWACYEDSILVDYPNSTIENYSDFDILGQNVEAYGDTEIPWENMDPIDPNLLCTACGARFEDQDSISTHLIVHDHYYQASLSTTSICANVTLDQTSNDEKTPMTSYFKSEISPYKLSTASSVHDWQDAPKSEPCIVEGCLGSISKPAGEMFNLLSKCVLTPSKRPLSCPKCAVVLASSRNLRRHLASNSCSTICIVCAKKVFNKRWESHLLKCSPIKSQGVKNINRIQKCLDSVNKTPKYCSENTSEKIQLPRNKSCPTEKISSSEISRKKNPSKKYLKSLPGYFEDIFSKIQCLTCNKDFTNEEYCRHFPCGKDTQMFKTDTEPLTSLKDIGNKRFSFVATCLPCNTRFSNLKSIEEHDPFRCEALMEYVDKHVTLRSPQESEALMRSISLTLLRLTNADIKIIQMNLKRNTLQDLSSSEKHIVSKKKSVKVKNKIPLQCKGCEKYFKSAAALKEHMRNESCEYECPECLKIIWKSLYNRHMETAHGLSPDDGNARHICRCGRDFESESHLKNHVVRCRVHKCPSCEKGFTRRSFMQSHARKCAVRVAPIENGLTCNWCNATFRARWRHVKHVTEVHNIKERVCKLCNQQFDSDEAINAHFIVLTYGLACSPKMN